MDLKKVLIGVAIIGGGAYWIWKKSQEGKSSSTSSGTSNAEGQGEKRACHCSDVRASIGCGETYGLTQCVNCCRNNGSTAVSWGNQRISRSTK